MKRFITYLYEYDRGQRLKNIGFIRIDERKGLVNMQVCVRNYIRSHEKGKVYAFLGEKEPTRIELGEVAVLNGQGDAQLQFDADDIMESGYILEDIVGIGVVFPNNGYLASCWKDEAAEAIAGGGDESPRVEFNMQEELNPAPQLPELTEVQLPEEVPLRAEEMQAPRSDLVTYQKMELKQIRQLPSPNWYLCNNRFLVHGFSNYGYLVLKKTMEADNEVAWLGVPGVFEKPEMVMAALFGFSKFEALPVEISEAQMGEIVSFSDIEKSQEPKIGTFGCWLIPLK